MRVERISKIRGLRIFQDFTWPADLRPFGRFNLIYGWNGTGKTTLAGLFRTLQEQTVLASGEVVWNIDGQQLRGSEIPAAAFPAVRVFNRDSIAAAVSSSGGDIAPIYFVGQDSVEKQRQVDDLKRKLDQANGAATTAQGAKLSADKALNDFCTSRGREISALLTSNRTPKYKNYDKRNFQQSVKGLTPGSQRAAVLSEDHKAALRSRKEAQPKPALPVVACDIPDFAKLASRAEALLKRSVFSKVIAALAEDRDVGTWVHQGLALHTGERKTDECRFCAQKIPPERIAVLEAHFNDAFSRFRAEIDQAVEDVEGHKASLVEVALPEPSRLYDHLAADLDPALAGLRNLLRDAVAYLESLRDRLLAKKESTFTPASLDLLDAPDRDAIVEAIATVNGMVDKHNAMTSDFPKEVEEACEELERCLVAESYDEYVRLRAALEKAESALAATTGEVQGLRDRIADIEREIVEHRRPADELNAELHAYLGRDELHFEVKETGYTLTRNGEPASGLSEGERTAIAFLYFLKSLQDKSFDLAKGVVAIDDPVSSLDANALFSAFGYMKERTKDAGQLFVFTHSFCFFRQVKNWFHYLNKKGEKNSSLRPACLYLLHAVHRQGHRCATLEPIDPLLEQYESEYHYLFKRVYEESQRGSHGGCLETCYGMPNIARRLVEAFLSFRFPASSGYLLGKGLDAVPFDAAKKARILRFVHTYSHHAHVSEPEHDLSVLSETGAVLGDVMALIEAADPVHFKGMKELVTGGPG